MPKNTEHPIFGTAASLPDVVGLGKANLKVGEEIPYQPVTESKKAKGEPAPAPQPAPEAPTKKSVKDQAKDDPDTDAILAEIEAGVTEDDADDLIAKMVGGNLDDKVERAIGDMGGGDDGDSLNLDIDGGSMEIDMFEPEMLLELIEDGRKWAHGWNFDRLLPVKQAKSIRSKLIRKAEKTEAENNLLTYIDEYCEAVADNRSGYMDKIGYSDKRRGWALKCITNYSKKITAGGKVPEWFILLLVFGVPEIMAVTKLQGIRSEIPSLDKDLLERLEAQLS